MGTDIHVYMERNTDEGWKELALFKDDGEKIDIYPGRCYPLFGILAGVRGDGELVPRRGLPDNLSPSVKEEYEKYKENWHSATYYDITELIAYAKTPQGEIEDWDDNDNPIKINVLQGFVDSLTFITDAYDIWYPKPNEVRVIMWFDS